VDRIKRERDKADQQAIARTKALSIDPSTALSSQILEQMQDLRKHLHENLMRENGGTDGYREYEMLKANPHWLEQHLGSYVAFFHGKLVGHAPEKSILSEKLKESYPEEELLILKVEKEDQAIHALSADILIVEDDELSNSSQKIEHKEK